MFTTFFPLAILLGLLLLSIILWATLLFLGLHWAQAPEISVRRVLLTTAFVSCVAGVLWTLKMLISAYAPSFAVGASALRVFITFYFSCQLISYFHQISFKQAFKA
ncbi:hypothetical protein Enr17x_24870 [Gimesia fumaroli]|uniref:Uncharacterized protein n=1 Tax=Gimesia fumaroli TaxID=2527976 RepID=A0A518IBG5_9PLAN|nr:hypothetical protein Enr17x_24870 [Gimesia fumaroli]